MSTQERALAPTSSGQPSQLKRPCCAPIDQEWSGFERNGVLSRYLVEAIHGAVRQELEHAMPRWAEYFQSFIGNALKDIMQQMTLKENDFQKQTKAVELGNSSSAHLGRPNAKSTENNGARNLQLQIPTKLSHPLFTGKKIEGEEGAPINVALIDADTGDTVTSGPESSIKLDVVALEGDFNKDNEDTWAPEEFENYIVKEREGKARLLAGNTEVKLKGGFGKVGQLKFTDNSRWNRSGTFRIGVKVASGFCGNTRIREAKQMSSPSRNIEGKERACTPAGNIMGPYCMCSLHFTAHRKHYPPTSDDEVWRLEQIAKDGKPHQKLSENGIYKVEDFLLQLFTDPKKLRGILGKSMIDKKWDSLVSHAKTCKTKWKFYFDYPDGMMKHGAVFNTNNKPIGLVKDGEYFAIDQLSAQEKEHGDAIVKKALDDWNNVREFNGETFSDSMQKNSLVPRICTAPVGAGSTAEGHNSGDSLALPVLLDGISRPAAHQPSSSDHLNVLISPEDNGFATVGSLIQSQGVNLQCDMCGQNRWGPCEPPHTSVPQFSSGLVAECNHMMKDHQPMDCDDLDCGSLDALIQIPLLEILWDD